uniref:Pre-mRNA polyadenylation factor Fip1 domain-containing protein n=1 Tax=Globisporangium ultimum (strain ATCC 200006 / CBS 805.95 / DAOM BR144) TaxID=431595 RepID=K3WAR0_GLOUD
MEDEEFGEDVLVTAKETAREAAASTTEAWKDSGSATAAATSAGDNDDDDEELYGGVSIKLNADPEKNAKMVPPSSGGPAARTAGGGNDDDDDFDEDEDEEDIAIVLNNDSKGSKPTLRFTGGGANRYVRGSFVGGPQHVPAGASHLHHKQGEGDADGIDDLAMFGGRRTAFDVDIDMLEDKPWRKPGVDISDYFNYGFDEHSWREYAGRQLRLRRDLAMEKTREQAARQAVSAASQPPAHDIKSMQGPPLGGGMPPRGAAFPGGNSQPPMQMGPGGSNNPQGEQATGDANQQPNGQWGPGGGMPPMGGMARGPPGPSGMAGQH